MASARLFRSGRRGLRHPAVPISAGAAPFRAEGILYRQPDGELRQSQYGGDILWPRAPIEFLGLTFYYLRKIHIDSFVKNVTDLDIGWRDKNALALLHALFCLIVAVALFLHNREARWERASLEPSASSPHGDEALTADKPTGNTRKWRRFSVQFAGVIVIVGLFAIFAERSVYRMQEQGGEDGRWCSFASTIEAIMAHPIFGTGFGAFQDVFPAYRNADCAGIFGVWDRAHNVFLEGYLGLGLPFAASSCRLCDFNRGLRSRTAQPASLPLRAGDGVRGAHPSQPPFLGRFFAGDTRGRLLLRRYHGLKRDNIARQEQRVSGIVMSLAMAPADQGSLWGVALVEGAVDVFGLLRRG